MKKQLNLYRVHLYNKTLMYKKKKWTRKRKVIAVDFDGTLSMGKYPVCGPANKELVELLKKLMSDPSEFRPIFILWTSRTNIHLKRAVKWLKDQDLEFDSINAPPSERPGNYTRKVYADLYVDDRAITPKNFIDLYTGGDGYGN